MVSPPLYRPQAIALAILVAGFVPLFFNVLHRAVAIVLAYLLEWPTVRLQHIGLSRTVAVSVVLLLFAGILMLGILVIAPVTWQQGVNLLADLPSMLNRFYDFAATLPKRYPALVDAGIIDMMAENMRSKLSGLGESVVKYSLASLVGY